MNKLTIEEFNYIPNKEHIGDFHTYTIYGKISITETGWEWFITGFDPITGIFFGFVNGLYPEWGYFGLYEINEIIEDGWTVVHDTDFKPIKFADLEPHIRPLIERDSEGNIINA